MAGVQHSCIYTGMVRHRRYSHVSSAVSDKASKKRLVHSFKYKLFMLYLDLSELDEIFKGRYLWSVGRLNIACLLRRDHFGDPAQTLDEAVRRLVTDEIGVRPQGPIRVLTHLRYWGYCFNPVSFYYCFDETGTHVAHIVAEVSNTPWGERHCYVLDGSPNLVAESGVMHARFKKFFHVSPFLPMQMDYDWRFRQPSRTLVAHLENLEAGEKVFDATLTMRSQPIAAVNLAACLIRFPWMSAKVIAAIYWQALLLWFKSAPFYSHPSSGSRHESP